MLILTICWRLSLNYYENEKILEASVLGGPLPIHESYLQEPHQILMVMSPENNPHISGRGRETILKYTQSVIHNKALLFRVTDFIRALFFWKQVMSLRTKVIEVAHKHCTLVDKIVFHRGNGWQSWYRYISILEVQTQVNEWQITGTRFSVLLWEFIDN